MSPIGQRVAVVGCSGSGKSTLARRIAQAKGLDYIKFDELLFLPDWVERPEAEYLRLLEERVAVEAWALDGNLKGREHIVLPRADTLIWLDYPRHVVMRRLLRRTIRRAWTKEPIFHNCSESWQMSFASKESILLYAWRSHARIRRQYDQLWSKIDPAIHKARVRTQAELDTLLRRAMT